MRIWSSNEKEISLHATTRAAGTRPATVADKINQAGDTEIDSARPACVPTNLFRHLLLLSFTVRGQRLQTKQTARTVIQRDNKYTKAVRTQNLIIFYRTIL